MAVDELELDPQLGPFYMDHGEEFIPVGFEESGERLAECLGAYEVRSNLTEIDGQAVTIGHYDLTKFIQDEWDKFVDPENPPRSGFFLSNKSAASAAGRAAEDVILGKLLWRCNFGGPAVSRVCNFWDFVDEGKLTRPKGVATDDMCVELFDGTLILVESKASFKGGEPFSRFKKKATQQLVATTTANSNVKFVILSFTDIEKRKALILGYERDVFLKDPESAVSQWKP